LGYDLSDQDLWDGWIIFEEPSAEHIVRAHLIRWFAPRLLTVRTVAANGTGDVPRAFENLYKLMLFTHLEPRYRGRVRVLVDGDPSGMDTVRKLRDKFPGVPIGTFDHFAMSDFELYYPPEFADRATNALSLSDRSQKREVKKQLLADVLAWIEDHEDEAREKFAASAAEVIEKLRDFEKMFGRSSAGP